MYKFIHLISALIRQFALPNPYINIIGNEVYAICLTYLLVELFCISVLIY